MRAFITSEGAPTIIISNHKSYTYSCDLGCWLDICSKTNNIERSSFICFQSIMYLRARGINFASMIFLLDLGTVPTVWYVLFFIFFFPHLILSCETKELTLLCIVEHLNHILYQSTILSRIIFKG